MLRVEHDLMAPLRSSDMLRMDQPGRLCYFSALKPRMALLKVLVDMNGDPDRRAAASFAGEGFVLSVVNMRCGRRHIIFAPPADDSPYAGSGFAASTASNVDGHRKLQREQSRFFKASTSNLSSTEFVVEHEKQQVLYLLSCIVMNDARLSSLFNSVLALLSCFQLALRVCMKMRKSTMEQSNQASHQP